MILLKYYIHYAYLNTLAWVFFELKGPKNYVEKLYRKLYLLKTMQYQYRMYRYSLKMYLKTGSRTYKIKCEGHEHAYKKHKKHYYGTE